MGIKRFIYNRLFNKRQRRVIWQALLYSEYRYKRRGNTDGAAYVRTVINEIIKTAGTKQRTYLESEVDAIVNKAVEETVKEGNKRIENAYKEGKAAGKKRAYEEVKGIIENSKERNTDEVLVCIKPLQVDLERCEECEKKDECFVKHAIDQANNSEGESEEKPEDDGENAEKGDSAEEAPKENEEKAEE